VSVIQIDIENLDSGDEGESIIGDEKNKKTLFNDKGGEENRNK
jgi:hypothetical protein